MEKETYWSRFANNFEELNDYVAGSENTAAIKGALSRLAVQGRVLELGCGNGTYSRILARTASLVVATDYSDEMVAASTGRLRDLVNVHVQKENCFRLSFEGGQFDHVVMVNLLHVVPEPMKAVAECRRVLVPGGQLSIISFTMEKVEPQDRDALIRRYLETYGNPPDSAQVLTVEDVKQMMRDGGFSVCEARLLGTTSKAVFVRGSMV